MAETDKNNTHLIRSFVFGFLFISIIILIFGSIFISKTNLLNNLHAKEAVEMITTPTPKVPLTTYADEKHTIQYPEDYQIHEDKIVATEGIVIEQENTIHLISPTLPDSTGNLSIILTHQPFTIFEEEARQGSTCAELDGLELEPLSLGNNKFTYSGLINCGPNQVAFFYILNGEDIYEAKVETTADYEEQALPEVLKILETIQFSE